MNETEYNEIDAIRATQIKAFATGGELALYADSYGKREDTPSMAFGRLCHELALLGHTETFVVNDRYPDFRTKEAREWKAEMASKGISIVSADDVARAGCVAKRYAEVCENFDLRVGNVENEVVLVHEGKKAQIDELRTYEGGSLVIDFKTTSDVNAAARTFWNLRYDLQAGHYTGVVNAVRPENKVSAFAFVFVETTFPFRAAVIQMRGNELVAATELADQYYAKVSAVLNRNGDHAEQYNPIVLDEDAHRPLWVVDRFLDGV